MDNSDIILAEGISKRFGEKNIFSNLSFSLKEGEKLVVLGRSGVGKSVLLKCISGLLTPDSGILKVFGTDISSVSDKELNELRTRIGYLFQSGALYDSMNIRENLLFPLQRLKSEIHDDFDNLIRESLESVGLGDTENLMPSELSGGMRKRAGLARTLVMQPEIILYDEPTTGLDPFTAKEISQLINIVGEKHQNSSIVVTHDMKCAEIVSDRILIIDDGTMIGEGTFSELKKSENSAIQKFFNA